MMFPPPFPVPGAPDVDPHATFGSQFFDYTGTEETFTVPSGISEIAVLATGGVISPQTSQIFAGGDALYVGGIKVSPGQKYRVRVGGSPGLNPTIPDPDNPFDPYPLAGGWNGGGDGWFVPYAVEGESGTQWLRVSTAGAGATTVALGGTVIVTVGGEPGASFILFDQPPPTPDSIPPLAPPHGPTFRRIVGARPTATQPPRKEYTAFEGGYPLGQVVQHANVGGEADGGNSARTVWPVPEPGDIPVTTITGAGGGGYGGGCSGIVVSDDFPLAGPPDTYVPLRGNYGGTHIKSGLFSAWVPQGQLQPSVGFFWLTNGGGAKWRVGRIGWGHGRWS